MQSTVKAKHIFNFFTLLRPNLSLDDFTVA